MTAAICLWSGPRNVSTALMYSFAQHQDIAVIGDGNDVMRDLIERQATHPSPRLFMKHMAHHLAGIDQGFLRETRNILLIRDPREMLPSLTVQLPHSGLADTGLEQQWQLFTRLRESGKSPVVIDSRELLLDPPGVMRSLCEDIDLEFTTAMLHWEAGPRVEDGIWAPHWYHAVHKSTGFAPYTPKTGFPDDLQALLAECEPWYDLLFEKAIRADMNGDTT
jgi:hypothetical protein